MFIYKYAIECIEEATWHVIFKNQLFTFLNDTFADKPEQGKSRRWKSKGERKWKLSDLVP